MKIYGRRGPKRFIYKTLSTMIVGSTLGSFSPSASLDQLVQQFRASERKTIMPVENRKTTLTTRLNVLGELKTKLDTLFSTVDGLRSTGTASKFNVYAVSSTLPSVAIASASSEAVSGTHTLLVTQLAKSDSVLSSVMTGSGTDIVTATGSGTKTFTVTVNGTTTPVSVTLNAGDSNATALANIASAVNASGANVSASVVSVTSTTSRLVITSKTTGSAQALTLANTSGTLLDALGLTNAVLTNRTAATSSAGGYTYSSTAALDANFTLDGIPLVRGSNSVSDALVGITLELKGTQLSSDNPVTLTVGVDKDKIKEQVTKFIKDYNDVLNFLTAKTAVDPTTRVRQILAGDQTFTNLRIQLRDIVTGKVTSVSTGNPSLLAEVGIEAAADGTLSLKNPAALEDALAEDIAKVADLFNSVNGVATRLYERLDQFVGAGGLVQTAQEGMRQTLKSVTDRIALFNKRLDLKADRFRAEFLKLQEAIARITQQQQALQNLVTFSTIG